MFTDAIFDAVVPILSLPERSVATVPISLASAATALMFDFNGSVLTALMLVEFPATALTLVIFPATDPMVFAPLKFEETVPISDWYATKALTLAIDS